MNSLPLLLAIIVSSLPFEVPVLQAKISTVSLHECRRTQSTGDLSIRGTFNVENMSNKTILIAKTISIVQTVTASATPELAKRKLYSFAMSQEFAPDPKRHSARLEDFVALKPGGNHLIAFSQTVVPFTTDAMYSGKDQLKPGKLWVQFQFSVLPLSFPWSRREFKVWRSKWKSHGMLLDQDFVTEPFEIEVTPNATAANCDTEN